MISKSPMQQNEIRNLFKNVTLRMDTDIKLAIPGNNRDPFSIFEIHYPGLECNLKINQIGFYAYGRLTYFNKDTSFYTARKNMSGILIRTGNRVRTMMILKFFLSKFTLDHFNSNMIKFYLLFG